MHWQVARMCTESKSVDPDTCFFCDGTPHVTCHECKVLHRTFRASILCPLEICVGLRQFWVANLAAAAAFAVVVVDDDATDNTRLGVLMCHKWYAMPPPPPPPGRVLLTQVAGN